MRKIYSVLFTCLFLILTSETKAQVSLYIFSQSNGTYTPITGGTVLGNTSSDDQRFVDPAVPLGGTTTTGPGFPIGFNFTFNGVVYDRLAINNNGWISLGQSSLSPAVNNASTSAYTPLSSTTTITPADLRARIAGMGRDLQAQTGSELRLETIGTAPNRKCVIQFTNYKRFGSAGTGDNFNFQIVLNETTNTVQVIFGTYVFNTTTTTSTINHIGLGGSVSTDFNNRQTTAPHDWNATSPGTANTQGCQNATSTIPVTVPVSGLTFTWTPPTPCTAPPAGGTTNGPGGAVCPGVNFTLTVSGASTGTGLTYQWESSPDNSTWTAIGGQTSASLTTSQTANTYYRRRITCSGVDAYSTSVYVTTLSSVINTFPWTENFDGLTTLGSTSFPCGWTKQNGDWRSANNSTSGFDADARSAPNFIQNAWSATNEYIWTPGFQLVAGTQYDFSFWFADYDGSTSWSAEVFYNTTANSAGATQLGSAFIVSGTAPPTVYTQVKRSFTPPTSGVYYFAIRVNEPTGIPWYLNFDDFRLEEVPAADIGPTALVMPSNYCPSPTAYPMAVTIRNFGANTVDFSLNPATITVNVTGAGTGTLNGSLNSGTLAVGASMNVPVSPSFAFTSSGSYNFDVTAIALGDGNAANNNYDTTVVINQPPAVVNLGPDATLCLNDGVVLNPGSQPAGSTFLWNTGATTPTYTALASGTYHVTVTSPPLMTLGPKSFTTNTPVNVLDNTTVNSSLTVSGVTRNPMQSNSINQVCINITHTWDEDMDIRLVSPSGTIMDLSIANGGSGDNYTNTCFSPTASVPITSGAPPFTGTFLPQGSFNVFNGQNPNGTWQLRVADNFTGDQGVISNWTITFNDSVAVAGTGCPKSDTVTITLNPQPVVNLGPDGVVCQGFNRTLNAGTQPAGSTFLWNTGATTQTISVNTTGLYWVEVTNSLGCFKRDSINITVVAPPTVSLTLPFDTLYANSPTQLLGGGTPSGTTGVYSGAGISGTSINPGAFPQGNHTVTYTFTDQNGCVSSATDVFTVIPKADKINVLPNPSPDGNFVVVVSTDLIGGSMTAYNQLGQKVGTWNIGGMYNQIKFPPYKNTPASGRYLLRIEKDGEVITKQLVIAR